MCRCSTNHINFVRVYLNIIIRYIQLIQPLALKNLPNPKPFLSLTQTSLPTRPKKLHGISQKGNPTTSIRLNGVFQSTPEYPLGIKCNPKRMSLNINSHSASSNTLNLVYTSTIKIPPKTFTQFLYLNIKHPPATRSRLRMTPLSFYTLERFILSNNTC